MRRLLTFVLVAAAAAGGGSGAHAQEAARRVSLFDLGLYGGGAWTGAWFEAEDEGFTVGAAPVFGVTATYWATPTIGVRYHTAYMPSHLPDDEHDHLPNNWEMNNWFFDLNLAFRPWGARTDVGNWMASTYFFLGGGALVTNIAGEGQNPDGTFRCVDEYAPDGICLSYDPEYATVGQANAGVGFDLFPITPGIGLFAELGVHGYDSPAHDVVEALGGEDRFAITPRLVAGLKFAFGDLTPPPPAPVAVPPVAPTPQPPAPPAEEAIRVCVVQATTLVEIDAVYLPATGDTVVVVQGVRRPFAEAYPAVAPAYAASEAWFINNEALTVGSRRYVRYGLPRVIEADDLVRVGEFRGVGVFAGVGETGTPEVVYVPVRPGCEFQPYQFERTAKEVRG